MKTPLTALAVVLVAAGIPVSRAQAPAPAPVATAPAWTYVVTPTVVSQFMFRGVRLGGPAFEPSFEADCGPLALGLWTNFPLKDKVPGQSDPETDIYGSYKFTLSDTCSVQPGFTWYNYVNADKAAGFYKTTFEPSIAFNYTAGGLTLSPKVYYDVILKGPTFELNAAYAIPLASLGTEIDLLGTVGTFKWDDALAIHNPDTKAYADYWLLGFTVPYQLTKNLKVSAGWAYTEGSNSYFKTGTDPKVLNTAAVGRGVVTLSAAWTF